METENKLYTAEDIHMAFDMGLESGLYVLERSIDLPAEDRVYLLEKLKKIIYGKRIVISQDQLV